MTDRELLELAAKAYGYRFKKHEQGSWEVTHSNGELELLCRDWPKYDKDTGMKLPEPTIHDALNELLWNPAAYPLDALRLAVSLPNLDLAFIIQKAQQAHEDEEDRVAFVMREITIEAAKIGKLVAAAELAKEKA